MHLDVSSTSLQLNMTRLHHTVTVQQAALDSPTLAHLSGLAKESGDRLQSIQTLIPALLRHAVRPGPIEGGTWCLLVSNNAVAAKLRQLLPTFTAHLQSQGWQVNLIRLKVQNPDTR
jgi:Dna[CI] antecedent, DciA